MYGKIKGVYFVFFLPDCRELLMYNFDFFVYTFCFFVRLSGYSDVYGLLFDKTGLFWFIFGEYVMVRMGKMFKFKFKGNHCFGMDMAVCDKEVAIRDARVSN